jgi:hypothetical protein
MITSLDDLSIISLPHRFRNRHPLLAVPVIKQLQAVGKQEIGAVAKVLLDSVELRLGEVIIGQVRHEILSPVAKERIF